MKRVDCRIDNVYESNLNSELWNGAFQESFEKRVSTRIAYIWFVNDSEFGKCRYEKIGQNCLRNME